jgi:hypothetical protein
MQKTRSSVQAVEALVGYAADSRGNGIAYARLRGTRWRTLLRAGFRTTQGGVARDRAVAYAALTAISRLLLKRRIREVDFIVGDCEFVGEISTGRGVGEALGLPYVRLRCILNTFASFSLRTGATDDLTQRARAEVALNIAA